MKLDQVLKEIGMDSSWEQQKIVLRRIISDRVFIYQDTEYRGDQPGIFQSEYDVVSIVLPASYKNEVMIKELSKPENFLDVLEFAYTRGVVHV